MSVVYGVEIPMSEVEKLALTLFLKTLRKPPALVSEDEVRLLVDEAHSFANGQLWIRYEPTLNMLICKVVNDERE